MTDHEFGQWVLSFLPESERGIVKVYAISESPILQGSHHSILLGKVGEENCLDEATVLIDRRLETIGGVHFFLHTEGGDPNPGLIMPPWVFRWWLDLTSAKG